MKINAREIAMMRMAAQRITATEYCAPEKILRTLGAVQAQDYGMAKWALGLRTQCTETEVEAALHSGRILRTHVLRPTWHFVHAKEIRRMLALSAPRIIASMQGRHRRLGMSPALLKKSRTLLQSAMEGGKHVSREEIKKIYVAQQIPIDQNRLAHYLFMAEFEGLISSGELLNGKPSYCLLDARVRTEKIPSREASLAMLAHTYFSGHGPATIRDFIWWSGLTATDARRAHAAVSSRLAEAQDAGQTYWFDKTLSSQVQDAPSLHFLPAFDEYLVGYAGRSAVLPQSSYQKTIMANGIFRPVLICNGIVTGIWKRTQVKNMAVIEVQFFKKTGHPSAAKLHEAAGTYGRFLAKPVRVSIAK